MLINEKFTEIYEIHITIDRSLFKSIFKVISCRIMNLRIFSKIIKDWLKHKNSASVYER